MARTSDKPTESGAGHIRVGIGGWTYEPWRGTFFPKGLAHKNELVHASRHVTSIEINGTFYRSQTPATFAKWRDETPDDFVFSVKAPRYIVQKRALVETGDSIRRFFDSGVAALGDKLGPILWQFAPTKKFDAADFAAFLDLLPSELAGKRVRHALEVRHISFACSEFLELARQKGAAIVIACESDYPQIADLTADFVYLRIMGAQERYEASYASKALDLWATRARALTRGERVEGFESVADVTPDSRSRDVFAYFISGFKARNPAAAMALIKRLT